MDNKKSISQYGKVFEYLKDPDLRVKEMGEQLMEVKGALVSGVQFKGIEWKEIRFIDCDFTGSYELKLAALKNCSFEGCRFAGLFGFGLAKDVYFNKCVVRGNGEYGLHTDTGSTNVVFENGDFRSFDANNNNWGFLLMRGEAKYINCYAKWFSLRGHERLDIDRCRLQDCEVAGADQKNHPPVTIIDTELLGTTDMVSSHMSSLTMRNCTVGELDLSQARVSGDVLIEKVEAEQLNLGFYTAGKVTLRNCKVRAPDYVKSSLNTAVDSVDQFIAENCTFQGKPASIGPGVALRDDQWSVIPQNRLTRFTNCAMEVLGSAWTESQDLRIEQCTISSADFSNSRIGHLQIQGSTISQKLDLRNTRIQTHSIKDLEPSKYRQVLLDGSSIKQLSI